jgi:hypothetical protein
VSRSCPDNNGKQHLQIVHFGKALCSASFNPDKLQPEHVQPPFSSSPTHDIDGLLASDPNVTKLSPEPCGPKPVPQPRSWLASLSKRGSSNVPLNRLVEQTPSSLPDKQSMRVETVNETTAVAAPALVEHPSAIPANVSVSDSQATNTVQPEADTKSISSRRPWFASSSSSLNPSKLRLVDEPQLPMDPTPTDPPIPETPQHPAMNVSPPTPSRSELTRDESRLPSDTVSVSLSPTRKWLSPVSSSQSKSPEVGSGTASPSSSQADVDSPHTSPSIDEQVSKLPPARPPLESTSAPAMSIDTSQTQPSLNPSASRFSLNIPFLGRSKVPLDSAIASIAGTELRGGPEADDGSPAPFTESSTVERDDATIQTAGEYLPTT